MGDVGLLKWEEIDRIPAVPNNAINGGWPCYEAGVKPSGFAGLDLCKSLYAAGASAVISPFYSYNHQLTLNANDTCRTGSSAISGLAFYSGGNYPASYDGALFFGDYARSCIWVMKPARTASPTRRPSRRSRAEPSDPDPCRSRPTRSAATSLHRHQPRHRASHLVCRRWDEPGAGGGGRCHAGLRRRAARRHASTSRSSDP